jgi:hypothetical protein
MTKAKILIIDIETSPNIVMSWACSKQFVGHTQIIGERQIVCISYKWHGEDKVYNHHWGFSKQCDKKLLEKIIPVMNKADLIVGQNHERFDIKWINTRVIYHRLEPINVKTLTLVDTMKMAKANFYFNSNSMAYMSKYLKIEQKMDGGGWTRIKKIILEKDKEALLEHIDYCDGDIKTTEELFDVLRPYCEMTKSLGLIETGDRDTCPSCASDDRQKWGFFYTKVGKYQKYRCNGCKHVYKDTRRV